MENAKAEEPKRRPHGTPPGQGSIRPGHGGRIGNTPLEPTDEMRTEVRLYARVLKKKMIARVVGISVSAIDKHFHEEYTIGLAKSVAQVGATVLQKALAGDMHAARLYLTTIGGWSTDDRLEIEQSLPDAPEQVKELEDSIAKLLIEKATAKKGWIPRLLRDEEEDLPPIANEA